MTEQEKKQAVERLYAASSPGYAQAGARAAALGYAVVLRRMEPEHGGGFYTAIPELGSATFNGCGETAEEALQVLDDITEELFPIFVEEGVEMPAPLPFEEWDTFYYRNRQKQ